MQSSTEGKRLTTTKSYIGGQNVRRRSSTADTSRGRSRCSAKPRQRKLDGNIEVGEENGYAHTVERLAVYGEVVGTANTVMALVPVE
jgi:hypothetical protein